MKLKESKKLLKLFLSIFILFLPNKTGSTTLVYNMKIRRVFNVSAAFKEQKKSVWLASAVPIIYKRDRHIVNQDLAPIDICDNRIVGGSLLNLRYIPSKHWWVEVSTGIEKEKLKSTNNLNKASSFCASRTGVDDIVFSGGYNWFPEKNSQIVLYALTGFPTKKTVTLFDAQDALVGTRFYSLGVGSEFSYSFFNRPKRNLIFVFQNRFLHFFNRSFAPILPTDAKIQPGNVTDLLFTLQYRAGKSLFESGYNATFFSNQAILLAARDIKSDWFVRNSFYANFVHLFKRCPGVNLPIIFGAGFNIARSNKFDTKIFAAWVNLSLIF